MSVPLGDVNAFDAEGLHQAGPSGAVRRYVPGNSDVLRQLQQSCLDEPADHAGVRTTAGYCGSAAGVRGFLISDLLTQGIIRALCVVFGIEIKTRPRFDDGVDVGNAARPAVLHQVKAGRVDREIDDEARAWGHHFVQNGAIVFGCQCDLSVRDATGSKVGTGCVRWFDHKKTVGVIVEMTLDQGERAAPDGPETDHHDGTVNTGVDRVIGHSQVSEQAKGQPRAGMHCRRAKVNVWTRMRGLGAASTEKDRPEGAALYRIKRETPDRCQG